MSVFIVSSKEDPAGTNIKEYLIKLSHWKEINIFEKNPVLKNSILKDIYIITINDETIRHENLDREIEKKLSIKPTQIIFISKHRSKSGEPTLTAHPIGNYKKSEFGGKEKTLVKSSPIFMTHLLRIIKKNAKIADTYHKVCLEVTHHGPYLDTPTLFTEVGSTKDEWNKKEPAKIIAKSLLESLEKDLTEDTTILVGIGGGHYAPRFTDLVFQKKVAFGHMIPKYQIKEDGIEGEMIKKALDATPDAKGVYIHRKSFKKSQAKAYKNWCEERNINIISSKDLEDL